MFSVVATLALVAGMLAVLAPGANAAKEACGAKNTRTGKNYGNLQTAINAAAPGDTIEVRGRCVAQSAYPTWFEIYGKDLTLVGKPKTGYPKASLVGSASFGCSVLAVLFSTVILTDLDITGGRASLWEGSAGCGFDGDAGGIASAESDLTLNGTTSVYGNTADGRGGGIYFSGDESTTLTLNDSASVTGNTAGQDGGGIFTYGTLNLNDSASVTGNTAVNGGGVYTGVATLTLSGSASVSGNTAGQDGGGILNRSGTLTLSGSASVSGNTAGQDGGGIVNYSYATVTLSGSSSVTGNTGVNGGGVYNWYGTLTLNGSSSVTGNTGVNGGGVYNFFFGTLILNDSASVTGNTADEDGGGIVNYSYATVTLSGSASVSGNTSYNGGGILNFGTVTGWNGSNVYGNVPDDCNGC